MSEMIIKKTLKEAIITGRLFDESLRKNNEDIPEMVEPLRPFLALKVHRSRIKCMKLAWDALEECANQDKIANYTKLSCTKKNPKKYRTCLNSRII